MPSVLVTNESVLRTEAATWWLVLLTALEQPHRPDRVRAACLTPLIGWSVEELDALGEAATDRAVAQVRELVTAFHRGGMPGVLDVLRGAGLSARILARVGGERDLTDVEHCAQVLQEHAGSGRSSLTALVTWLLRQSAEDAEAGTGTRVIRLDSDAHAVTLSTIHGSKGLQYPVVHAPFLFSNWIPNPDPVVVHRQDERVIAFGEQPGARAAARQEVRRRRPAPGLRRDDPGPVTARPLVGDRPRTPPPAVCTGSCSGEPRTRPRSPPSSPRPQRSVPSSPWIDRARNPRAAVAEAMLGAWAQAGAFSLARVPDEVPVVRAVPPQEDAGPLGARDFTRNIDRAWKRTSYSALAACRRSPVRRTSRGSRRIRT